MGGIEYRLWRHELTDGAVTTVYAVLHPRPATRLRAVHFPETERLDGWCAQNGIDEAIIGGFFLRDPYRPLGELVVDGEPIAHEPVTQPYGPRRACIAIAGDDVRLTARDDAGAVDHLIQAGPLLVRDGEVVFDRERDGEGFSTGCGQFDSDITDGRHPRAALGVAPVLKRFQEPVKIITAWLFFSLLGLSLYNQPIYIHYLGLVYPLVFILVGAILALLLKKGPIVSAITLILVILLVTNSLQTSPTFGSPNRQLQRTEEVVDLIIRESKGEPFNLGLIAKNNYDQSYRYFLENKKSSLEPDQNRVTQQLFVICEDGEACKPEGHSQYQIAVFGIAHVNEQWSVDGIKIYRLIH